MYIDVSSNQGRINWREVANNKDLQGVILRATTQNNKLDVRTMENYNAVLQNLPDIKELSAYKFSYARDYIGARIECAQCLTEMRRHGVHFDYLYLDLESHGGRDYTTSESNAVILGYMDEMAKFDLSDRFRLYFNYNYLKNIIAPIWWQGTTIPIWLARYNTTMGETFGANVVLWQYTSAGRIDGITGNVDISKEVTNEHIFTKRIFGRGTH